MLRIFLYSAIIIGCFANFARNGWGFELRGYAELILGITFIVELIASLKKKDMAKTKGNRILTNYERFFIFTYFLGGFFKSMHWPGAGILIVFSLGLLIIFTLIRFFAQFHKNKLNVVQTFTQTFFLFSVISLIAGIAFKMMHWPFGSILITLGLLTFILTILISFRQNISSMENVPLKNYIAGKFQTSHFIFFYFGVWSIYVVLAQNHLAPKFYTSENPYIYEKLLEDGKTEEAETIHQNYSQLLEEIHLVLDNGQKVEGLK
jgi:hypothetical protein